MKKGIIKIAEYIVSVATIAGAALWLDARFDNEEDRAKKIIQQVEYINAEQSMMAEDILYIKDTVIELGEKVDANSAAINMNNRLMKYERQHRDEYSKEQLEDQLREFEELLKKNGNGIASTETPSDGE